MSKQRAWILVIIVLVPVLAVPRSLTAAEPDRSSVVKVFNQIFTKERAAELISIHRAMKEAGFSYQEELTAGRDSVVDCKDQRRLQVLVGVYSVDADYARWFAKTDRSAAISRFIEQEVTERLDVRPKVRIADTGARAVVKRFLDDPRDEANLEALQKVLVTHLDSLFEKARTDPAVMDYVLDRVYGGCLEVTYLACKLSLAAPANEKTAALFDRILDRARMVVSILEAAKDPQLQALLQVKERLSVFGPIGELLGKKQGRPSVEDLRFVLEKVEPVRNALTARCK